MACKVVVDQYTIELPIPESLSLLGHQGNIHWYWILRKSQWRNHRDGSSYYIKGRISGEQSQNSMHANSKVSSSINHQNILISVRQIRSGCQSPVTFTSKDWVIRKQEAVEYGLTQCADQQSFLLCLHVHTDHIK